MKILGRAPKRFLVALLNSRFHILASVRCIYLFHNPLSILLMYFKRQNPESLKVKLKNGIILHLSQDSSDIVTVYLIFCRRDYGLIMKGSTVVDIGANIGLYSVYAAMNGAAAVYAYEPCTESYGLLEKNISENGFNEIIKPVNAVVMGKSSVPVLFPRK
jgi:hypothetical protein